MKESTLSKNIAALIRKEGGWAKKVWGGGLQAAGWPDIIAVYRGVPLWLETKLPGKEKNLTKLQAQTLKEAKEAGAVAKVVSSTEQVKDLLNEIDRIMDRIRNAKHRPRKTGPA